MPTHQSLGGASDEQLLQRMVATHSERYGQDYWAAFDAGVAPHLPASPVVIDLGCGPGLFLRDLARRDPSTRLYGYDVTPAMIAYGRGLAWPGVTPTLLLHDVTESAAEISLLSDRWERFFAAEAIREQIFSLYHQEVPHAAAVVIDQFHEEEGRPDAIKATLYVERDSQKPIILGRKGETLRLLVQKSKESIELFLGRRVELDIWVKVRPDWRKNPQALKEFGY